MRKGWLIAAALSGAAGAAHAADVNLFGINTTDGHWAVYARVSDPSSEVAGQQVSSLSSIFINVLNGGPTGPTILTSVNNLPQGTTPYTDNTFTPSNVGYGFWLFRSDGTVGPEPVDPGAPATGRSGSFSITAAQYTFADVQDVNTNNVLVPYSTKLVLNGVGLTPGAVAVDSSHTSATAWSAPVQVASGTYTPGSDPSKGLEIEYVFDSVVGLIRDSDPTAGVTWARENAVGTSVIDARNYTLGQSNSGNTTVRAGVGDANLDGLVSFPDLVKVAQNYGGTGKTWLDGDFNFDGVVSFADLVTVAQHYGAPAPSSPLFSSGFDQDLARAFASVPEPSFIGVLGTMALGFLGRRRKLKNA
jgi:hypothetical protein